MKNNKILILESLFSFFIIITISAIITLIVLRIKSESKIINSNSEASVIITNILENMKSKKYTDIEEYINNLSILGISKQFEESDQIINVDGNLLEDKFFGTEIPKGYIVNLRIHNLNEKFDIQKSVNIVLKNSLETLEVSTILTRDVVDVCNKPQISEKYFNEFGISLEEYEVIPIKYSYKTNSYVVTTKGDDEWYNYYSKDWAKVLIFSKYGEDLKNQFIDKNGNIRKQIKYNDYLLDLTNYIYVWIPNFSIKDNNSFFRYESAKNAIKQEMLYSNGEYLYLNTISDNIQDVSEECSFNGINGVWRKINDIEDVYLSTFNSTKFGPVNIY